MALRHVLMSVGLAIIVTLGSAGKTSAQVSEEDQKFMLEILEASNSVSAETAREAHRRCVELSKKLSERTNVEPLQRLYFEAEIESCIFYAMNNGEFSDETGDSCSHHYAFATKLAEVITRSNGKQGFVGELMREMANRLETATQFGEQLGCKGDYEAFKPAIEMAREAAAIPLPEPDFGLWEQIMNTQNTITAETARDGVKACLSFASKIAEKPERPAAERALLEAQIERCVSFAMETGKFSDETGDMCTHHYRYATRLTEAVLATKSHQLYASTMGPIMAEDLRVAIEQGPIMGCKQDYGSLKQD